MDLKPIILLVLANDKSKSLDLTRERDALKQIFPNDGLLEIQVIEQGDMDSLYSKLSDPTISQRIVVFHFAGHAGHDYVELIDGQARAKGLAALISMLPNLQLVFLNGCLTITQTEELIANDVKAVITTVKPIRDEVAIDFATSFYTAFYKFNTLNDSFAYAKAYVLTKYNSDNLSFTLYTRGLIKADDNMSKEAYSLSTKEDRFLAKTMLASIDYITPPQQQPYMPNINLILSIAKSIIKSENKDFVENFDDIVNKYNLYQNNTEQNRYFRLLSRDIIEALPFPIGFHVGNLLAFTQNQGVANNTLTTHVMINLLKKQIITFNSFLQLLTFILLSCLWKELEKTKLSISLSQWRIIKDFLASNELNNQDINYPALLITTREILADNKLIPFIAEYQQLKDIFDSQEHFYSAHLHIQGLKTSINNGEIMKMDPHFLCFETEKILSKIFYKADFIVKYKLATVKTIEFNKSRLKSPKYYIKRIMLNSSIVSAADVVSYSKPTDSDSVILTKGLADNTFIDFISLSPFIIDENSLKGEDMSKLYFYSHSHENNYVYRLFEDPENEDARLVIKAQNSYTHIRNLSFKSPREIDLINERMGAVKDEIDAFKELVHTQV